jgi:hypothetical protein
MVGASTSSIGSSRCRIDYLAAKTIIVPAIILHCNINNREASSSSSSSLSKFAFITQKDMGKEEV